MIKKKLLAIAAVVVAALVATGVGAWLSDNDTATDEMTTGKVNIKLLQTAWDETAAQNVKPNGVLPKNPQIRNVGVNPAYVFLTVEMAALPDGTRLHDGINMSPAGLDTPMFATETASGAAYDSANWILIGRSSSAGRIRQIYAWAKDSAMTPLERGEQTSCVFDRIRLANVTDTAALQSLDTRIVVTAYGIQTTELGEDTVSPMAVWDIVSRYHASKAG